MPPSPEVEHVSLCVMPRPVGRAGRLGQQQRAANVGDASRGEEGDSVPSHGTAVTIIVIYLMDGSETKVDAASRNRLTLFAAVAH